jgi:ribokinase
VKLLVIGNATIDRSYRVDRLPHEGESVLAVRGPGEPGGKGLNQAVMAARAGAAVALVVMLGSDGDGERLRRHLATEGLPGTWLLEHPGCSDESIVVVGAAGENLIVTTRTAAAAMPASAVSAALDTLDAHDLLLMQGNLDVGLTVEALARAKTAGQRTLFNPSPLQPGLEAVLPFVDVLIANAQEAAALDAAAVPARVTTLGAAGARLETTDRTSTIAAPPVEVVDTTGAGDVLAGVLAGRLAIGDPLEAALGLAVRAASLKVGRAGTGTALPSAEDLRSLAG